MGIILSIKVQFEKYHKTSRIPDNFLLCPVLLQTRVCVHFYQDFNGCNPVYCKYFMLHKMD